MRRDPHKTSKNHLVVGSVNFCRAKEIINILEEAKRKYEEAIIDNNDNALFKQRLKLAKEHIEKAEAKLSETGKAKVGVNGKFKIIDEGVKNTAEYKRLEENRRIYKQLKERDNQERLFRAIE